MVMVVLRCVDKHDKWVTDCSLIHSIGAAYFFLSFNMLPHGVSRASPALIALMQLFANVLLFIRSRRRLSNLKNQRILSLMSIWNGTLVLNLMRLFWIVMKWIQIRKSMLTKPHNLISLLAQYRYMIVIYVI